jgi:hypothetical protein
MEARDWKHGCCTQVQPIYQLLCVLVVCCSAAENVAEEIYGVEHLDALGSHKQEW